MKVRVFGSAYTAALLSVAYFALLLSPNAILVAQWDDPWVGISHTLAPALAFVGVIVALTGRVWIAIAVTLPFALTWPIETFYIMQFRAPMDAQVFGTIVETNSSEAASYLSGLWGMLGAVVALVLALWTAALIVARHTGLAWTGRTRVWALLSAVGALGVLVVKVTTEPATAAMPADAPRDTYVPSRFVSAEAGFPSGLPIRIWDYYEARRHMERMRADGQQAPFGARQGASFTGKQAYLFVIGETGRRDRWQLNGYARQTSPHLAALPGVVWLSDVVSPWSQTRMSVPVMLTRKTETDRSFGYHERSLIAAFREAGFRTYWLSTQASMGRFDSPIAALAQDADVRAYLNSSQYGTRDNFDGILLPALERILQRPEPRQLIVIHTRGSHDPYSARYPIEFARFQPLAETHDDESLHRPEQAELLSNAYDNSVLYTDWVLSEMIARLLRNADVSALLFAADHGEMLFDNGCKMGGHGSFGRANFEVAALAWYSPGYKTIFPEKVRSLRYNAKRPLSTRNLFASMLGMADIQFPGDDPSFNVFSDRLRDHVRIVNSLTPVDYDRKELKGVCELVVARDGAQLP